MSMLKKVTVYMFIAVLILGLGKGYGAVGYNTVAVDDKGGFYVLHTANGQYAVTQTTVYGNSQYAFENLNADGICFVNQSLYVYGYNDGVTVVMRYKSPKVESALLEGVKIRERCFTANRLAEICLVRTISPTEVSIFNVDGQPLRTRNIGKAIKALFAFEGQTYAVTADGVTNVETNQRIVCEMPSTFHQWNGSYCTDGGTVYRFDTMHGFVRQYQTDYTQTAVVNDTIYGLKGNTIFRLDRNGTATQKYSLGQVPDELLSGGNTLAVRYGDQISVIRIKEFESTEVSSSSSEGSRQSESTQQNTNRSQTSKAQHSAVSTEPKSYRISSEAYTLDNGWIYDIPQGTTIAQLKKGIDFGDNTVSFLNNKHQPVKSGTVGTGWTAAFSGNGKTTVFRTVVDGDITGEGNVNRRDRAELMNYLVHKITLTDAQKMAADCNHDGVIDSKDLWLMKS